MCRQFPHPTMTHCEGLIKRRHQLPCCIWLMLVLEGRRHHSSVVKQLGAEQSKFKDWRRWAWRQGCLWQGSWACSPIPGEGYTAGWVSAITHSNAVSAITCHYSDCNTMCVHTELQQHKPVITVTPTQSVSIQHCNNTNQSLQHKACPYGTATAQITVMSWQSLQHKACPYRTATTQISHVITVTANTKCVHTELQQHKSHVTITQHGSYKGHKHFLELVYNKRNLKKCIHYNQSWY